MEIDYYELEDRGHLWIYHWIVYMIGGLRRLPENANFTFPGLKDQGYHGESLALIEDRYKMLKDPINGKRLGKHHGEPLLAPDRVDEGTYHFLRDLFLTRVPGQVFTTDGYIYITRKRCDTLNPGNGGRATRQILNEEEILPGLRALGFEILQFEDYSFQEKIAYFQKSRLIISPNSGALTFSLFANKAATIIEILPANTTHYDHYKIICKALTIPFQRFSDVTVVNGPSAPDVGDFGWNMNINADSFFKYLRTVKNLITPSPSEGAN